MRTIFGLLTVLLVLGPIGMGMIFTVEAPQPSEGPSFLNLYFQRPNYVMNTSSPNDIDPSIEAGTIVFTLQDPLVEDFVVQNPSPGYPMTIRLWIRGNSGLATGTVTVEDSDGTTVGTGTIPAFNTGTSIVEETIEIPFSSGTNYTFLSTHQVVARIQLPTGLFLHYDSETRDSYLRLYCKPIPEITIATYNFYNEPATVFYPNNLDFPDDRKQVRIKGTVTDVFNKADKKYIDNVEIWIRDPSGNNDTYNADWNRNTKEYSYTWVYSEGQDDGEYTVTTHVFDEQDNEYTVSQTFNMSNYGVRLTAPSQVGGEGTYKAEAKRNVIKNSAATYYIKVWNIGNFPTEMNITTSGQSGWDWWLEGGNFTTLSNKTGVIASIDPGSYKGFNLIVSSKNNDVGAKATISVTATCAQKTSEDYTFITVTTVVLKYDIELRFIPENTKSKEETIELDAEVTYDFKVTNEGGVDDRIYLDMGLPPGGWSTSLSGPTQKLKSSGGRYYVDLIPTENVELEFKVKAPDSGGDDTAVIDIIGTSQGSQDQGDDPVVSDRITTYTSVTTGLRFNVTNERHRIADPDDLIIYELELSNTGTSSYAFTVSFTHPSLSDGWDYGDVSFSQGFYTPEWKIQNLSKGDDETIFLYVKPTNNVIGDKNYTIPLLAVRDDSPSTRRAEEEVSCYVNAVNEIEVEPIGRELYGEAEPGKDVEYTITIMNNGNVPETVSVEVDEPGGWKVDFGNASGNWFKEIDQQDNEIVSFILTVPDDATGDETVDITVSVIPVERPDDTIEVETHTKIKQIWWRPFLTLLVPLGLFIVIIILIILIYRRR